MHRHGVVMGPQAVCSVTAELSRPEGRQWVSGGSWTAGFKNPRSCKSQNPKSHFQSTTLKVQVQVQNVQNWPHFSSSSESSSNSNGLLEATDARSKVGFCPDTERREVRLVAARLILGRFIEGKPFNSVQAWKAICIRSKVLSSSGQSSCASCSQGRNLVLIRRADAGLWRVGRGGRRGKVDSTLIDGSSSITVGHWNSGAVELFVMDGSEALSLVAETVEGGPWMSATPTLCDLLAFLAGL